MTNGAFSRRRFLGAASITAALGTAGVAGAVFAPGANAQNRVLGTALDYSAGVPSGRSVRAAGHKGAVRYVSQPRPEARSWMVGKPVSLTETRDFAANGLFTASVYQFGRATTADWLGGAGSAAKHAPQAIQLHRAAGGPNGKPIYVAIDDNPTRWQYENQIRPYLRAFQSALTVAGLKTGVYGNYNTIQWCIQDGIGTYYWQHDWGSGGRVHPRANIHQVGGKRTWIDGVECDVNNIYKADWGQWQPGRPNLAPAPAPARPAKPVPAPAPGGFFVPENSSLPNFSSNPTPQGMSSEARRFAGNLEARDVQNAVDFARQFIK